ncbi:MAG: ankyrin repeat domain-containing protein [Alphaproteobacteria bacterium]
MTAAPPLPEIQQFMNSAWDGDVEALDAFLDKYPDAIEITKGEPIGWTALMWAARSGNKDSIELLLGRGAKIEARDGDGMTPLMLAGHAGNISAVQQLLDRGADPLAVDTKGRTAAGCARAEMKEVTAMILDDAIAAKQQALAEAAQVVAKQVSDAERELQDRMRAVARSGKFRIRGAQP